MKFLASSSYDYMKLMVMELQQKLSEIEEMEKSQALQQKSLNSNSRANPFNKNDTLNPQRFSEVQSKSSSWTTLHAKFGTRIANDRDKWCLTLLQN